MEIHKPKAAHSWREFLIEIGTIICGILIALTLEQAVEWMHGRELARQTEEDLAAGLRPDLLNAAELWSLAPCGEARIKVLADKLQQPGANWTGDPWPSTGAARPIARVYFQPGYFWSHAAWEAAVSAGSLVHMPRDRVAHYADAYRMVELIRGRQIETSPPMMNLSPLGYDRTLSDSDKARYLSDLGAIEEYLVGMSGISVRLLRAGHDMGLTFDREALATFVETQRAQRGACVRNFPTLLPAA